MNKILFINGSPRGVNSNSAAILQDISSFLKNKGFEHESEIMTLPRIIPDDPAPYLEQLALADVWLLSLPLYVDALPGHLTSWLSMFEEYRKQRMEPGGKEIQLYGIVNCGFPEAIQNKDALGILKSFALKTNINWRMGIGIGKGEAYRSMQGIPLQSFMKKEILKSFNALAEGLLFSSEKALEDHYVSVLYPNFLYRVQGSLGWILRARKNGVQRKGIIAQPYRQSRT